MPDSARAALPILALTLLGHAVAAEDLTYGAKGTALSAAAVAAWVAPSRIFEVRGCRWCEENALDRLLQGRERKERHGADVASYATLIAGAGLAFQLGAFIAERQRVLAERGGGRELRRRGGGRHPGREVPAAARASLHPRAGPRTRCPTTISRSSPATPVWP